MHDELERAIQEELARTVANPQLNEKDLDALEKRIAAVKKIDETLVD